MYKFNSIKARDIQQGLENEKKIFDVIKEKWNISQLTKTSEFYELDFVDENNVYYEVKSRTNNYNKYPTTMIGLNKIEFIKNNNLECIFVFAFTDGNYYYKYNKDDEIIINNGGRKDRGKIEYKPYAYIPINKLIKI